MLELGNGPKFHPSKNKTEMEKGARMLAFRIILRRYLMYDPID